MKRIPLLVLTIFCLAAGCSQTTAPPVAFRAQGTSETSTSLMTRNVPNLVIPKPILVEANASGQLGVASFGDQATVHVSYPGMAVGDTVGLRWQGTSTYDTAEQVVSTVGTLVFKIPRATVVADVGGTAILMASVGVGGNPPEISALRSVTVVNGDTATLPRPRLEGLTSDGEFNVNGLTGASATVQVDYPTMKVNDVVGLRWKGKSEFNAPTQKVSVVQPLTFALPKTTIAGDLDSAAVLSSSVGGNGNPITVSQWVSVKVVSGSTPLPLPPPQVAEVGKGELDLNDIGTAATVLVDDPLIVNGATVAVRWTGKGIYTTPVQVAGATRPMVFSIPKAEIQSDLGGSAVVTTSVGINGNPLIISGPLNVSVVQATGAGITAAINTRYRDTTNTCSGNKPAYYCDGVVIRSVDDGAFDPWNPSPTAITLGGVSFSYIRVDSRVTNFYRDSGFLYTTQEEAIARGKAPDYLCIYPHDAATLVGPRPGNGCGLRPRSAVSADLSTCASVGVTTVAQWRTYTASLSGQGYQCSFSVESPGPFAVSIEARSNNPPNLNTAWNELMVATWPQDYGKQLPIQAFFYKSNVAASLAEARNFQTKYKNKTQRWVPILKLDFAQVNASPFSYNAADQAVQP